MPDDHREPGSAGRPRVLVRPVAVADHTSAGAAGPWPQVELRHGESPTEAARRAVTGAGGPAVAVGRPLAVTHLADADDTLVVELEVSAALPGPADGDAAPGAHEPPPGAVRARRLAAYAVIVVDDRMLLTQLAGSPPHAGTWTLPGGGLDPGESPVDAVVREVHEETGHVLRAPRLLDVDSAAFTGRSPSGRLEDFHGVGVIYRGDVVRVVEPHVLDVGGSTSAAAWVPLAKLPDVPMNLRSRARLRRVLDLAGYGGTAV